ncbi:MAG: sodium:solute symporter [Bacteroidales bacterium]|nr:sodium:solute symporter [Bacteroidales bacterium]
MEGYGFWSVVPPLIAIILAIRTRQVLVSLLTGLLAGNIILAHGNVLAGTAGTVKSLAAVFASEGSTMTIMFTLLMGVIIAFIQRSGGVEGFISRVRLGTLPDDEKSLDRLRSKYSIMAALTGLVIFVESNISSLTVGTLFRPVTDRLKIPREKLAYIADSTSAPSSVLIPLNAWGGFIMGLLVIQGFENPFGTMLNAMIFNFYPILTLILVFFIAFTGKDFGPMRKATVRARREGKLLADNARPMVSSDITILSTKENITPRAVNMFLPIGIMVVSIPLMLVLTGWQNIPRADELAFMQKIQAAIAGSSGAEAVLYSVLLALAGSIILYASQKVLTIREMTELAMKGMGGMIQMALLMVFAFALGNLCSNLGTGTYVAGIAARTISPSLVPFVIFIISCFIAFSTGTSWGTFAIMIPLAVPMATEMDASIHMAIAAALGGGVFGDHCSPVSDTTIISSMASASDHIDHVRTQLPYALLTGLVTASVYLIYGIIN